MTSLLNALPDPALRSSFRRYYVWRTLDGRWRARPLTKLSPDEVAFGVLPELSADSLTQLAGACVWQTSRLNICRRLAEVQR
ncbi:hypothetical protein ABZ297_36515 [Nonomuraea sp. NPDC005983]|uniref:hypothetical protein n=1 Tax=Nonomuraea sp. NPDC005983 TaxID=3155595 RepID=UPI0033A62273